MDIKKIADLFGRNDTTADALVREIGTIDDKGPDQWSLKSRDSKFKNATLFFETGPRAKQVLGSVKFDFVEPRPLAPADLTALFGNHAVGPPYPDGPTHIIHFDHNRADNAFSVVIAAVLTGPPDAADTRVSKITIIRGFPRQPGTAAP